MNLTEKQITILEKRVDKMIDLLIEQDVTNRQKCFKSIMEKFGITSPTQLDDIKKKEFFNEVKKNTCK